MDFVQKDRNLIWHPFTQEKTADSPIVICKGKGAYLYDDQGKQLLDLVSSWWVNIHGHANEEISKAIYHQCNTLEHVIFAGFTHEPAINLCDSLSAILPSSLRKFFFTDNGSTAVEVAVKMSYQCWKNRGYEKPLILCLEGGYHGDTLGAMNVGAKSGFHDAYKNLLTPMLFIPFPDTWIGDDRVEEKEKNSLEVLKAHLITNKNKISALIIEPLVQGAAGMRMCRSVFVEQIVKIVRENNILVIFDEVMTGFGRTGTYFALEQTKVAPDFLCISKGITGGFLPLALTVTTVDIYEHFLGPNFDTAFAHGHSYTANAVGCAAAIASLKLLTSPATLNAIANINKIHNEELVKLMAKNKEVTRIRVTGTIAAFDLKDEIDIKMFKQTCLENGVLIRPLKRSVYILPPYCITTEQLKDAYVTITSSLSKQRLAEV